MTHSARAHRNRRCSGLVVMAAPFAALAQLQPQVLETQRVTATTLPTTPAAASQHVTVLTRADLDALRGQSLADVLSRQAGIVIDRGPRSGGYGALYLRGADPSHVVVLIDHVRQNDPLSSRGSAVDFSTLSVDDIERIEIVRGNASVANAEAMAGLIHIFTRRDRSGSDAAVGLGGDGLRHADARWAGANARLGAACREDADGSGGFSRSRVLNASWGADLGEALTLQAAARLADSVNRGFPDDSGGPRFATLRGLDARHGDSQQVSLRGQYNAAGGTFEGQIASLRRDGEESTPGVAPGLRDPFGLPAIRSGSDYRRSEAQAQWTGVLDDALLLTVGAQYQHERGVLDSLIDFGTFQLPAPFSLQRDTRNLFAEVRWQRGDWTLQGGLRHDWRSDAGAVGDDRATHPMLSLQHANLDGGQWGLSWARASKAPSFYALGQPLVGNPALAPETSLQRELYYATSDAAAWPTRITVFSARYGNLVDFDAGPPPQLVNRARIEADGIEWRSRHAFSSAVSLQLDGAWMRVRDPQDGVELRHRPHLQAGAQLDMQFDPRRGLSLGLRHLGSRIDSSIPTGQRRLSALTTLDLSLRQQLGPVNLLLAVDNLGNTREDETLGTPLPGRRVRFALQWSMP